MFGSYKRQIYGSLNQHNAAQNVPRDCAPCLKTHSSIKWGRGWSVLRHCDPLGNWQLSTCHPIAVKTEVRDNYSLFDFVLISEGSVLIFVTRKAHSVDVAEKL